VRLTIQPAGTLEFQSYYLDHLVSLLSEHNICEGLSLEPFRFLVDEFEKPFKDDQSPRSDYFNSILISFDLDTETFNPIMSLSLFPPPKTQDSGNTHK
jgi:hypothetical protein